MYNQNDAYDGEPAAGLEKKKLQTMPNAKLYAGLCQLAQRKCVQAESNNVLAM